MRPSAEVRFPDPPAYLREAHSMPKGVLSGSPSAADAVRELKGGRVNAHLGRVRAALKNNLNWDKGIQF